LPGNLTWDARINAYAAEFGRLALRPDDARSDQAATAIPQGGSKPEKKAQTDARNDQFRASSDFSDRHQARPVETNPDPDQHQDRSVHLNVEDQGGEGREAKEERGDRAKAGSKAPGAAGTDPSSGPQPSDGSPLPQQDPASPGEAQGEDLWTAETFWGSAAVEPRHG
jgi:hypothetical protein